MGERILNFTKLWSLDYRAKNGHPNLKHSSFLNYMIVRYKIHQEFCSYNSTSLQNLISIQNYEQK